MRDFSDKAGRNGGLYGWLVVLCCLPVAAFSQSPAPAAPAATVVAEAADKPPVIEAETSMAAADVDDEDVGPVPHSMFYAPEEMNLLMQAIRTYERLKLLSSSDAQNKAKDFLSQLEDAKRSVQIERNMEYPQFYLESLVYHTPDDWFVQINGEKMSPVRMERFGLKLLNVEPDKVLLEWRPTNMKQVNEVWAKAHNDHVIVERKTGTVTFTLLPNQTFSSYKMRVMEGKVRPVKLDEDHMKADKMSSGVSTTPLNPLMGAKQK